MAPKKGGEGGGIGLSSGSGSAGVNGGHNTCANSDAISQPLVVGRLVIDGLCLLVIVLLTGIWFRTRKRRPSIKQVLPGNTFGTLLVLSMVYPTLGILISVLGSCFVIGPLQSAELSVPASVTSGLANILVLAIILLPLTRHLLRRAGQITTIVTIINSIAVVTVAVAFIPSIILSNIASVYKHRSGLSGSMRRKITDVSVKVSVAYWLFYIVASLIGSAILIFAILKAAGDRALSTKPKIWIIVTISTLLISGISVAIEMLGWAISARAIHEGAWIAFLGIFNIFFVLTIFGILKSAESIAIPMVDPTNNATYDPDEPALHKRFTYTGSSEIPPAQYHEPQTSQWGSPSAAPNGFHSSPAQTQHAF